MNREQINKIINDRIEYFINANKYLFVKDKELNDMRYALNLVKEDINTAMDKEREDYLNKSRNLILNKPIEITSGSDDLIREIKGYTMNRDAAMDQDKFDKLTKKAQKAIAFWENTNQDQHEAHINACIQMAEDAEEELKDRALAAFCGRCSAECHYTKTERKCRYAEEFRKRLK